MDFRILVVDDEKLSRRYIRAMVSEFEPALEILEADNPESALELLAKEKIDILFLDIMMPGMSGFDLLENITDRDFELVFITAYNQFAIDAIHQGAADYLLKPIRKSDFKAMLQKVISVRKEKIKRAAYIRSLELENQKLSSEKSGHLYPISTFANVYEVQILTDDDWTGFRSRFDVAHPGFLQRLREKFPSLTQAEIRLIALSKLQLTTKEMAGVLGVSPETIRQTRWRLKKKLDMEEEQNLNDLVSSV